MFRLWAEKVAAALPLVDLPAEKGREAEALAQEITREASESTPAPSKLYTLGYELRAVLEHTAGHMLGSGLLDLLHLWFSK